MIQAPFLSATAYNTFTNPYVGDLSYYTQFFNVTGRRTAPFDHVFSMAGYSGAPDLLVLLGDLISSPVLRSVPFVSRIAATRCSVSVGMPALAGLVPSMAVMIRDAAGVGQANVPVTVFVLQQTSSDAFFQGLFGLFNLDDMLMGTRSRLTNSSGVALFDDLAIGPGYPGTHQLFFFAGDVLIPILVPVVQPRVISTVQVVRAAQFGESDANVASELGVSASQNVSRFFVPFSVQPVVRLLDGVGSPVAGVRCIIAGWNSDPNTWDLASDSSSVFANSFVGNLAPNSATSAASFYSQPSDSSGLAVFENMGIWFALGARTSVRNVSLIYFADVALGSPYSNASAPVQVSDAPSIVIVQQPSTTAVAGVPFVTPLIVSLRNVRGELAGATTIKVEIGQAPAGVSAVLNVEPWPFSPSPQFVLSNVFFARAPPGDYTLVASYPEADSVETVKITVVDKPFSVVVLRQPPPVLRIGQVFRTTARAVIQSGSPMPGATLQARLVGASSADPASAAAVPTSLDSLSLSVGDGVQLDPFRTVNVTGADGSASFLLTVLSAPSGYYSIVFTSGLAISLPSTPFLLINPVKEVRILTQPAALFRPLFSNRGTRRTVVLTDKGDRGASTIVQPRVLVLGLPGAGAGTTGATLSDLAGPAGQLVPLANVTVTAYVPSRNAIGANGTVTLVSDDILKPAGLAWTGVTQTDENGVAQFDGLYFTTASTGSYRIVFRALGVDSPASAEFFVTNQRLPDASGTGRFRVYLFVVLLILLPVLFANLTVNSRHSLVFALTVAVSILIVSFFFLAAAVDRVVGGDPFQVTLNVTTVIVLVSLWLLLLGAYVATFFARWKSSTELREVRAFATVRRLLRADSASAYWEDHFRKQAKSLGARISRAVCLRVPACCKAKRRKAGAGDGPAEPDGDSQPSSGLGPAAKHARESSRARVARETGQQEAEASAFAKINQFAPWEQSGDFMYPQRFQVTFAASMVALFVAVLGAIVAILWLQYSLDVAYNTLIAAQLELEKQTALLQGSSAQAAVSLAPDVAVNNLNSGVTAVKNLARAFTPSLILQLRKAIAVSGSLSLIFSLVLVLVLWQQMFARYRQNICRMRAGRMAKVLYKVTKYGPGDASAYLGTQAVHTFVGFALTFGFSMVILFLLVFGPARTYLFRQLAPLLLSLLTLNLAMTIGRLIVEAYLLGDPVTEAFLLPHPRLWAAYELLYSILNVVNGVTLTIVRLVASLSSALLFFVRMDMPIASKTREHVDPGFRAYVAMLLLDYHHNHPVVIVFDEMLLQLLVTVRLRAGTPTPNWPLRADRPLSVVDAAEVARTPRQNAVRMRWALCVTLARNPGLVKLRAWAIADARSQRATVLAAGIVLRGDGGVDDEIFAGLGGGGPSGRVNGGDVAMAPLM